jgi:hypothetical protein
LSGRDVRMPLYKIPDLTKTYIIEAILAKKMLSQRMNSFAHGAIYYQLENIRLKISSVRFRIISSSSADSAACKD